MWDDDVWSTSAWSATTWLFDAATSTTAWFVATARLLRMKRRDGGGGSGSRRVAGATK